MPWILAFHLFGSIVWLGGLIAVAGLMLLVPEEVGMAKERMTEAAKVIAPSLAVGAALTIIMGIILIVMDPGVLHQGWLHAKLAGVALLIVAHVSIYRRIARIENEPASAGRSEFILMGSIVSILTLAIILLTMFRPF